MRPALRIAIAGLSALLVALATLARCPAAHAEPARWPPAASAAPADPAQVLIVGDSLAVGMMPFIGEMITDRQIIFDARAGWTTPQGMRALRGDLRRFFPQSFVISLGSNDSSNARLFAGRVRRVLASLPPEACVVWPAISRPRRKGDDRGLNRALRRAAVEDPRLTVVNWDRMVAKGTVSLPDDLHPDPDGFRFRSYVVAAAVQRGCSAAPPLYGVSPRSP